MSRSKGDLSKGLTSYKAFVFGVLDIVMIVAAWNDKHYYWFEVISLLAWVFYLFLAFFVAGAEQDERELKELEMLNKLKERDERNANEKENNEED